MTLLIVLSLLVVPSDTLHLDAAYHAADAHFARRAELDLETRASRLRQENLDTRFLPTMSLSGQAVYHSEVAAIPIALPGASPPSISRDQYRVALGVDQLVYDGGATGRQRDLDAVGTELAHQEVHVAAYALREHVENAYFGVLMTEAESDMLVALRAQVASRREQAIALVARGVVTQSDADVLTAELLNIDQQAARSQARRRAALDALAHLTGNTLGDDTPLALPRAGPNSAGVRPEARLFDLTRERLDRMASLADVSTRPKVVSFGEAAVGRPPGLNLFEDRFRPYFSVGLRVAWPVWDWRRAQREREVLHLQSEMVDARESQFFRALEIAANAAQRDLEAQEQVLRQDAEIVNLRERIAADAQRRFEGGVITATDYLAELTAAHRARLTQRIHHIERARARTRLQTLNGAS